jgi:hypothetical protein
MQGFVDFPVVRKDRGMAELAAKVAAFGRTLIPVMGCLPVTGQRAPRVTALTLCRLVLG